MHDVKLDVLILIKAVWCTSHNHHFINQVQHTQLARTFETLNFDQIRQFHVANCKKFIEQPRNTTISRHLTIISDPFEYISMQLILDFQCYISYKYFRADSSFKRVPTKKLITGDSATKENTKYLVPVLLSISSLADFVDVLLISVRRSLTALCSAAVLGVPVDIMPSATKCWWYLEHCQCIRK